jgi:3-keto-disaccharide hydrolase
MLSMTLAFALSFSGAPAAEDGFLGAWDIAIVDPDPKSGFNSSWWKIEKKDGKLAALQVWKWGSVEPVDSVEVKDGEIVVKKGDQVCRARVEAGKLRGTVVYPDKKSLPIEGTRAPELPPREVKKWGKPITLFDGKTLDGWRLRIPTAPMGWEARDGALVNERPGTDIMTRDKFKDFKLHLEYNVAKGSNSGIYLRGRYEVQIQDDFGKELESHGNGSVYSRIPPRKNACKPTGEWQTFDITLVGRKVDVVLNGVPVIENGFLEGITGGAFDPREGEPGPILLQGDHGKVSFRNIVITPAE